jgi:hypothetical protein
MARMTGPFADRLFRIFFALAGIYNLAFGVWASFWPLAFFRLFDLESPRYPQIWACLGMVVGVYGLLYFYAASKLDSAWPIIAVGLLGKVLGPIGMAMSFNDAWPQRVAMLCVSNDLIWWLPFVLFLIRGTGPGRRIAACAPWLCVGVHAAAVLMLVTVLAQGTQAETDVHARAAYVLRHPVSWSLGWSIWMAAAASLVGFYAWWGSRLATDSVNAKRSSQNNKAAPTIAIAAVVIAAIGMVCDFSGEGSGIVRLPEYTVGSLQSDVGGRWDSAALERVERDFRLCSAGAANGLYTLAGMILTLATRGIAGWVRALMWATWTAGVVMTISAVFNWLPAMVVSTTILFPLLLVWVVWMGVRWRAV